MKNKIKNIYISCVSFGPKIISYKYCNGWFSILVKITTHVPSGQPPFYQQTQHVSKPNLSSSKKPRVLSRVHINPEPSIWIHNSQVFFHDHIDSESSIRILNLARVTLLFRDISLYDEGPLQGLSLLLQRQINNTISMSRGINCTLWSFSRFRCCTTLTVITTLTAKWPVVDKDRFICMSIQTTSMQSKLIQDLQFKWWRLSYESLYASISTTQANGCR